MHEAHEARPAAAPVMPGGRGRRGPRITTLRPCRALYITVCHCPCAARRALSAPPAARAGPAPAAAAPNRPRAADCGLPPPPPLLFSLPLTLLYSPCPAREASPTPLPFPLPLTLLYSPSQGSPWAGSSARDSANSTPRAAADPNVALSLAPALVQFHGSPVPRRPAPPPYDTRLNPKP